MDLISRRDAVLAGEKYYFTGKPCKNGHITKRYVENWTCYACILARVKLGTVPEERKNRLRLNARIAYRLRQDQKKQLSASSPIEDRPALQAAKARSG